MSAIIRGSKFPPELQREMFNKVRGKSSIAKMSGQTPIPFNGIDVFTFSFDNEISVVGEGANKPAGDATITPVQIRPIKVIYQSRVNEEFMYAAEESQLQYLKDFAEGFAKKIAKGMDIMIMSGFDPKAGSASAVIGNNHLDYIITNYSSAANKVTWTSGTNDPVDKLEEALAKVEDANGIILGPTIRTAIAGLKATSGGKVPAYPEFAFGGYPERLGNCKLDVNNTVEANSSKDRAFVANWDAFKWGFAKEMPLEVIEYGDPDGAGVDLKRANQVLLRSEAYIGWGFLDNSQFASVVAP